MNRSRLRALEIAGLQIAIEVPFGLPWEWPSTHADFACAPHAPDLTVGVRVAPSAARDPQLEDAFVYDTDGATLEVGRHGTDWVMRLSRGGDLERSAVFDECMRHGEVTVTPGAAERCAYPLAGALEELLVMHRLSRAGGLLLRGSAVLRERRAVVFLGASPTHVGNFCGRPTPDLETIAGERVVLRLSERGVRSHAVPWDAVRAPGRRLSAPVHALHSVVSAPIAFSERIGGETAVDIISRHAFAPVHDPSGVDRILRSAGQISVRVPVLRLGLPQDRRVVPFTWGQSQAAFSLSPPVPAPF